jgi:hypothetical protein
MAMKSHGVSPKDHELGACIVQLDQQVTKIVGQLDHSGCPRANRMGMVGRV